MKIKRVKTFVKGLDKEMEGGIPEGSMVMIASSASCL